MKKKFVFEVLATALDSDQKFYIVASEEQTALNKAFHFCNGANWHFVDIRIIGEAWWTED